MMRITTLAAAAVLTIPTAALAQEKAAPKPFLAKMDPAKHQLAPSPYMTCENGECMSTFRPTWSNLTQKEVDRRVALEDPTMRIVEDQKRMLDQIYASTEKAMKMVDALREKGHESELVDVTIFLEEQPFDFRRLRAVRGQDKDAFDAIVRERDAQLAEGYQRLREVVEAVGGQFGGGLTFTSAASALVPAGALEEVLGTYEVLGLELDGKDLPHADGNERRLSVGLPANLLPGLDGGQGSTRSGGPEVRVGVIEVGNSLNTSHTSWPDWTGGPSRIIDTDNCRWVFPVGRRCNSSATTTGDSHGTNVMSVLLGSIEQGQNSGVTTTLGRRQRSGIAREAEGHYYRYSARADLARAFDEAARDNSIDIINLSAGPNNEYCNNGSYSGVQGEVQAATDAGILIFVSAGNDADNNPAGTCTVSSYGAFPDTVTVGATADVTGLASLATVDLANYSGRGSVNVTLNGGRSVRTRFVDIIATGDADLVAAGGNTGTRNTTGTSFSSPLVAGTAALLKDWVHDRGSFGGMDNDPYALRTLLMVMGDGVSSVNGGGTGFGFTVSDHSGFGHLRFINLDNGIGSGGWGLQRRFVTQGQVVEWPIGGTGPESSNVTGWKFAATWDWNSHGGSPDIKFELIDRCPGQATTVIRTAARHPHKARIRMRASEMAGRFHGRCLFLRATVEHASGTVPMYTADYFYTNARTEHDM